MDIVNQCAGYSFIVEVSPWPEVTGEGFVVVHVDHVLGEKDLLPGFFATREEAQAFVDSLIR